jgi:hypothetical protein
VLPLRYSCGNKSAALAVYKDAAHSMRENDCGNETN